METPDDKEGGLEAEDCEDSPEVLNWQSCECGEISCVPCRAERAAIVSIRHDKDLEDCLQDGLTSAQHQTTASTEDLLTQLLLNIDSGTYGAQYRNIPLVSLDCPGRALSHLVFLYVFHPLVADSFIYGRTQFSYASPMVVYLFAYNFMLNPSCIQSKELPPTVLNQVVTAMVRGNERFETLFLDKKTELSPEEMLQAWQPDITMTTLFKYSTSMSVHQTMYEMIENLQRDQVLLVFREKPYKVMSIVCTADSPQSVCLFDSQIHKRQVKDPHGAFLFYCRKDRLAVSQMMIRFEAYCYTMQGECHFVLLQRQHN